jgi:hypothetical protein
VLSTKADNPAMSNSKQIRRGDFLKAVAAGGLGATAIGSMGLVGCGDDGETTGPAGSTGSGGGCASPAAAIQSNHGHSMTVSKADVDAGVDKSYSIQGTAMHDHTVNISALDFADLASGKSISVTSSSGGSGGGHTHVVDVSCA